MRRLAALGLLGVLAGAADLEAQVVRGQVLDGGTGAGVAGASVEAIRAEEVVARTATRDDGSFEIRVFEAGTHVLRASALGYRTLESAVLEVRPRELVEVTLRLSASPLPLDGITVEARRRDPRHAATYEGLYARAEVTPPVGSSRVVLRGSHEMANQGRVRDVLRWFPSPRGCVDYYINGEPRNEFLYGILDMPPEWLEGIEFYRNGLTAPIDYFGGPCEARAAGNYSVIAVWYRRPGT